MLKDGSIFLMLMVYSSVLCAQMGKAVRYQADPQSHLFLNGSATLGSWSCGTGIISGYGIPARGDQNASVKVSITIKNLDCGNEGMNEDMYKAMNANKFPQIQYELLGVNRLTDSIGDGVWIRLQTRGKLTINNVAKTVDIEVNARRLAGNKFQVIGSKELAMSDFNITPPSAFFGLIKAHDDLEVKFDIATSV